MGWYAKNMAKINYTDKNNKNKFIYNSNNITG